MKNLPLFQYLTAFVTIVLAIALSDLLMSAHRLIVARTRVRWSVIPLAVAGFMSLNLLSEFFSVWVRADVESVSFFYLLLLVFVSACAAIAAFAALPDEVPADGVDLWASYTDRRVYLYSVFALGLLGDIGRTIAHHFAAHRAPVPVSAVFHLWPDTVAIAAAAMLAWSKDWRGHAVGLLVLYGWMYYAIVGWTIR